MGLLDMLQDRRFWSDVGDNAAQLGRAASNAAATNLTGPVDLASFLLSRIGIPVGPAPVGGTEWARQKGLTTGPQSNQMAQIVGETLGNVAPFVGVAKAPEIAGGLLQMIRNARAPSALNSQSGAMALEDVLKMIQGNK